MLAVEIDEIFRGLLSDYAGFQVENMLGQMASLQQTRGTVQPNAYTQAVRPIRKTANDILINNSMRNRSDDVQEFMRQSEFGPILPGTIANFILLNLTEDPARAGTTGETQYKLEQFHRLRNLMNNFSYVVDALSLEKFNYPKNEITLKLSIPDERYAGDIGLLGHKLQLYENFISAVIIAVQPGKPIPRLIFISSGSVIATLAATAVVAQSLLACYKATVEATQKCIDLLKAMKVIKDYGALPTETILDQDFIQDQTKKIVDATIDGYFKQVEAQNKHSIDGEAKTRVMMAARFVVQETLGGTKISLDIGNPNQIQLLDQEAVSEETKGQKLIEMSKSVGDAIKSIVDQAAPLLQIAGPKAEDANGVANEV